MAQHGSAPRRPPTPRGRPVVGQTIRFGRDAFGCIERLAAEHGGVFGLDVLGIDDLYVLAHPDYAEQMLVTERDAFAKGYEFEAAFGDNIIAVEGDAWSEQRQMLSRFFSLRRIGEYAEVMTDQTDRRIERWRPGERRQVLDEMKNLTLDIVFATVLGHELSLDGDEALRKSADGLNGRFAPKSWVLPEWLPTPARRRFDRSVGHLREEVMRVFEDADPDGDGDDLMSVLAGAYGSEGYPRSMGEIRDQLVGMIFAGHETTALALTFTWYALATNPDVRERFHAEIDDVLGDEPATMEDLPKLEYMDLIFKESLRLYSPIHGMPRETTREVEVGDYVLPEGATVLLSPYLIHRDERYYDDPEAFRPERWDGDLESRIPDFAYFPFGGGPRRCIGQQFAAVEAKTVLSTIGQRFHLEYDGPGLKLDPEMTTHPAGKMPMIVRER